MLTVDADLRPAFNWNTAQLFVYVSVEWESDAAVRCCHLAAAAGLIAATFFRGAS